MRAKCVLRKALSYRESQFFTIVTCCTHDNKEMLETTLEDFYLSPLMPAGIGLSWVSTYHLPMHISKPLLHVQMNRLNLSYRMGVLNFLQSEIKANKGTKINESREITFFGKNGR